MKPFPLLALVLVLLGGCAGVGPGGLSSGEKRALLTRASLRFEMPAGRENETYAILQAVKDHIPTGRAVDAIKFASKAEATVDFSAPPPSLHADPFAKAT
jgi:hypothetical protein